MAGIYIHIPFCRRKCHYCNFFSLASQKTKGPFMEALKMEIRDTRGYLAGDSVQTVYFGGGTPSVYDPAELQKVLEMALESDPSTAKNTSPPDPSPLGEGRKVKKMSREITLEMNPEDVTKEYAASLKDTWFNRFSLGVQSFSDEDLSSLNRSHSAAEATTAVKLLQEAGYRNISIDLIYGIPSSTTERWVKNLETAFSLDVQHISAYALTVEPKTPLAWMIDRRRSSPVSEVLQVEQFNILMEKTKENGFLQYEISNFCKPGWHSIHNSNYWNGISYLGLGPSAHSYNGVARRWNVSNLSKYIENIRGGDCIRGEEVLNAAQKYNEYVMTSLRTMWGFNPAKIISGSDDANREVIKNRASSFVQQGLLTETAGVYFLTDRGKLFADGIAAELFL